MSHLSAHWTARLAPACLLLVAAVASGQETVDWQLTRVDRVGGLDTTVLGQPGVTDDGAGRALEFDGQDDGIVLAVNPLAGLKQFTVEVIFRPLADGPREQRFVHFQEAGSENRLLFEIRLRDDNHWFLDTFLKTRSGNHTLYAEQSPHPLGPWYHAAVVVDGQAMRHYVDGRQELATAIQFEPFRAGQTSLGVRINRVSWYRGSIRRLRVTPRVLEPGEFLKP